MVRAYGCKFNAKADLSVSYCTSKIEYQWFDIDLLGQYRFVTDSILNYTMKCT